MNMRIEFCQLSDFLPEAQEIVNFLEKKLRTDINMAPSQSFGVFDVFCDDMLIFSRSEMQRLPLDGEEILELLC